MILTKDLPTPIATYLYLGVGLGITLHSASFGFAGSWRAFIRDGRSAGLRAQMLMLLLASALFLPVLQGWTPWSGSGVVAPLGLSVLVGAFLFGIGMQLGGGCASGTLYTAGGGSPRMLLVLVFFVVGSVLGAMNAPWWFAQGDLGRVSAFSLFDSPLIGFALQALFIAALYLLFRLYEQHRQGKVASLWTSNKGAALGLGAILLALLNALVLINTGSPWSVSFGYALWGAKAATTLGVPVEDLGLFWTWPYPAGALEQGIFGERTSVMNLGILIGAFLSALALGSLKQKLQIRLRPLLAAVIGGLLMGYGARLAYGCNIGALFSGIASGSLHGWLWFAAAFAGTWLALPLRRWFQLDA